MTQCNVAVVTGEREGERVGREEPDVLLLQWETLPSLTAFVWTRDKLSTMVFRGG